MSDPPPGGGGFYQNSPPRKKSKNKPTINSVINFPSLTNNINTQDNPKFVII